MALLWADTFNTYGADESNMTDGLYAEVDAGVTLETDPDPLESGRCILMGDSITTFSPRRGAELRYVLPSAQVTSGVAFRLWCDDLPEDINNFWSFTFSDINNNGNVVIRVLSEGTLQVARGDMGSSDTVFDNILGATSSPVITTGAWNHIEFKTTINGSTGVVEIRVNGIPVLSLSGQNTNATGVLATSQFSFGHCDLSGITEHSYYIKDFIVWDDTGSQNNDFFGTVQVYDLFPDGDSSLNWDTSSGVTGFNLIDETTPNDADYISADDTPPSSSEFTLENLPPDITSIRGVIPVIRATKTDGGDGNLQTGLISNGSTDTGTDQPITTSYTFWYGVSELSPDTGSAYTPTEIDNLIFSIDRTT